MSKNNKFILCLLAIMGGAASNVMASGVPGDSMSHNPALNVVLEGRYVNQDETHFSLPGFQATEAFDHMGIYETGFSTGHNSVNAGANLTEHTSGTISFSVESHDGNSSVDLEEAFVETKALGNGVMVKAGQFYSGIGSQNVVHGHAQDFANVSLVYLAMFGGHLSDTGVQLRWENPGNMNFNFGIEKTTGASYPGGHNEDNNAGTTAFAKIGGVVGDRSSWNGGVSIFKSDFDARHTEGHHAGSDEEFEIENGSVTVTGIDLEYIFSPNGKGKSGELKVSAEYFKRDEDGEAMFTDLVGSADAEYEGEQSGYYIAAVYRFMPKWRVGIRFDHIESDNSFSNIDLGTSGLATVQDFEDESRLIADDDPERTTLMVDYAPNHNSVIRLQYMQDNSGHEKVNRTYLQYVVALGGHGH